MGLFKKIFSKSKQPERKPEFAEGDIFYIPSENGFQLYKILKLDKSFDCYHVLAYERLNTLPDISKIDSISVGVYHMPVDKNGFEGAKWLTNSKVISDDLVGYHEYLRQTQELGYQIQTASEYYQTAFRLTDQKKYTDAIDFYSKAIDLAPTFFEAIDNRAFCKMDIGLWVEAIADFQMSLEVKPGSLLAEFSIGECYLKLFDYNKAIEQFEKAIEIAPLDQASKDFLRKAKGLLASSL